MVTQVTNFARSGVADWVIQRATAVVLAVYTVFLFGYLVFTPDLDFASWKGLFDQTWVKIFSLIALLATCAHAWIGMWTIGTDYIREHYFGENANRWRAAYQFGCVLVLFVYLLWGSSILWGL